MLTQIKKDYLGGEKIFPLSLFFKSRITRSIFDLMESEFKDFKRFETLGAHSSLLAIIDNLKLKKNDVVLLPSYICASVLKSFQFRGVKIDFYSVNEDLNIDVNRILIDKNIRAVLFIDYMGKSPDDELLEFISMLKQKSITVIQDVVQSVSLTKDQVYGDFAYNSFRKITPLEGSFILTKREMSIQYKNRNNWKFLLYKRVGQLLRYLHLKTGLISSKSFRFFLNKAEEVYYDSNIYKLPLLNKYLLSRIPFEKITLSNKKMFDLLFREFKHYMPLGLHSDSYVPFGFFIIINQRSEIIKKLQDKNIFCPIHWQLPSEVSSEIFPESWRLSLNCLTIPFAYPLTMTAENILKILRQSLPIKHTIDTQ